MPQVDHETLVRGSDPKNASESLNGDEQYPPAAADKPDYPEAPPDFPGQSFQLRQEDELDWIDRNALYLKERKDFQKGNSNPNSISTSDHNPKSSTSSQRFSLNFISNSSIFGLLKLQKSSFLKSRKHCRPPRTRFFPKRPSRSGKSLTLSEPSSPKVSCIGRVRSNRGKNRRYPSGRRPTDVNFKPKKKTGFWACFKAILRFKRSGVDVDEGKRAKKDTSPPPPPPPPPVQPRRWSFAEREQKISRSEPLGDRPGLGGMKRFASGRKSESWVGIDLDFQDSAVDDEESVPQQHSIWRRRSVDPPKKIDSVRDWEFEGPASV